MLNVSYLITYGEIKFRQDSDNKIYTVHIHFANALCAFIHHRKKNGHKYHELITFFNDEKHIRNCEKNWDGDCLKFLSEIGKITNISLNLYYKNSKILLNHFTKAGYKVNCYYNAIQ